MLIHFSLQTQMKIYLSKFKTFSILYFIILILAILLPTDISDYNYMVNSILVLTLWLLFPNKKIFIYGIIALIILLLLLAFTFNNNIGYYLVFDLVTVIFLLQIINLKQNYSFSEHESKSFALMAMIWIFALIFVSLFKEFYNPESARFLGLIKSTNLSSSIFVSFLVFLLIQSKNYSLIKRQLILVFLIIIYCYILWLTKSRTLIFALPFLLYQFFKVFGFFRVLLFTSIVIIIIFYSYNDIIIGLRIEKDSSFITRMSIYLTILEELKKDFFLIPNGFNADNRFIDSILNYAGPHSHTLHNDVLKYLYNFGILFIIFMIFWYRIIRESFGSLIQKITILLIFSVNAFHNTLFSFYILVPFLFIIMELERQKVLIIDKNI